MTASWSKRFYADLETYSSEDIKRAGVHRYVEAPDFEILLMSYAFDDDPVRVWDFTEQGVPPWLKETLIDPTILKLAWNIPFERTCLNKALGIYTEPEQWRDIMTLAAMNGLPMALDAAGAALNLTEQKLDTGKALIRYFCQPCKATISNGGRTRNLPEHNPEKWAAFKDYCVRDTEVERTIYKRLLSYPVTSFERELECVDARINERGVLADVEMAKSAVRIDDTVREHHMSELKRLTGLENPNSVSQLKEWLEAAGVSVESLNKTTVEELKKTVKDPTVLRVLELRQLLGKTSTKKYTAALDSVCQDHRMRGLLQFYGAGRTGRWAGRRFQYQNLAKNYLDNIAEVREIAKAGDTDTLEMLFDSVPDVLSQLIRTVMIAKPGHTFLVCDYSAIEARTIAWLAREQWRLDVFANGGDIYCSSAAQMFKVPVEKKGINSHLRPKGKIAELACGYGGGVGALKAFGADKMGLTEEEMNDIVTQWRQASPNIVKLWYDTERTAKRALENPGKTFALPCGIKYRKDKDALRCRLLSGRILTYWNARLEDGHVCFMGTNQITRKWEKMETFSGRLVENVTQAVARDCLAVAIVRLERAGYPIVASIHDEVVVEAPIGSRLEDVADIMGEPIEWAPGLLLEAEGYTTPFYLKA